MPFMRTIDSSAYMKKAVYYFHMFLQFPFKELLSHIRLPIKIEILFRVLCDIIK